jgi:Cu(I)/Ag(I) efflux system membrane fusion protein
VVDTGNHRIVFVVRRRHLGRARQLDVRLAVTRCGGLHAGERVVTAANFLVDSESRFRAALAAYQRAPAAAR